MPGIRAIAGDRIDGIVCDVKEACEWEERSSSPVRPQESARPARGISISWVSLSGRAYVAKRMGTHWFVWPLRVSVS